MAELTVGYVAGMIAAAVFLARQLIQNSLVYILSGLLGESNTAASWTVAASAMHQSSWAFFLQSDETHNKGVRGSVLWASRLLTIMGVLLAIVGVVTPLGLYDHIAPGAPTDADFVYAADTSPFGYGTQSPSSVPWSRLCGPESVGLPCPFTDGHATAAFYPNSSVLIVPERLNTTLPKIILDTYSSGTNTSSTISNFFDIRWRQYSENTNPDFDNGKPYPVGAFSNVQSLVLDDKINVREGLVIDTKQGGIGFRNHTVPLNFPNGVSWEENLLFVEPESVCVDTNLTLDFKVLNVNSTATTEAVLTDRGGFINLNYTVPVASFQNRHRDPELYAQASRAAFYHNALLAIYLNVTNARTETMDSFSYVNTAMNKTFDINYGMYTTNLQRLKSFSLTPTFGNYLEWDQSDLFDSSVPGLTRNVYGIQETNFSAIHPVTAGVESGSPANISNILTMSGLMRSVPQRQGEGNSLAFETGSRWSQKMYVCTTAVKATIKTVAFSYNRTDGKLDTLNATAITDRHYSGNESMPVWGVEDTGNRYKSSAIKLIWGLVSPWYEGKMNVSTVRQPSLYIPGYIDTEFSSIDTLTDIEQNLPASDFAPGVLARTYCVEVNSDNCKGMDYSGFQNLAMWTRWQNLTSSAEKASLVPNLIFTDTAASAVTGSRGVLGPLNAGRQNRNNVAVTPSVRVIRYRLVFATPAILSLVVMLILVVGAILVTVFGQSSGISALRRHLRSLAPGRIYTTLLNKLQHSSEDSIYLAEKEWNSAYGKQIIDLSAEFPALAGEENVAESDTNEPTAAEEDAQDQRSKP